MSVYTAPLQQFTKVPNTSTHAQYNMSPAFLSLTYWRQHDQRWTLGDMPINTR